MWHLDDKSARRFWYLPSAPKDMTWNNQGGDERNGEVFFLDEGLKQRQETGDEDVSVVRIFTQCLFTLTTSSWDVHNVNSAGSYLWILYIFTRWSKEKRNYWILPVAILLCIFSEFGENPVYWWMRQYQYHNRDLNHTSSPRVGCWKLKQNPWFAPNETLESSKSSC